MNRSSLPARLREEAGSVSRGKLYQLFYYHLYQRNWDDYPSFCLNPTSPPDDPGRILIIALSSIGDVTYAQPTISSVKTRWAPDQLDFVCEAECSLAVKNHPGLDHCWTYPFKTWDRWRQEERTDDVLAELRSFLNQLRKLRYDFVINLHWSPFASLLAGFINAGSVSGPRIGPSLRPELSGNPAYGFQYQTLSSSTTELPLNPASKNRFLSDSFSGDTHFFVGEPSASNKIRTLYKDRTTPERKHLLINTGSRMKKRQWPVDHCLRCLRQLDPSKFEIGLIGGPTDKQRLENIERGLPEELPVQGWFRQTESLEEDLVLSDLADLTVTTDTGPMNLISIRGNRVLDVAGDIWVGPWNRESAVIRDRDGRIDRIDPPDWLTILEWLVAGGEGDCPRLSSMNRWYRSPLPVSDPWFRHLEQQRESPDPEAYKRWESGMVGLELWSRQARSLGWQGIEGLREDFLRLREMFWPVLSKNEPFSKPGEVPGLDYLDPEIGNQADSVREAWR